MEKHIVLSEKTYAVNIFLHAPQYAKEFKKMQEFEKKGGEYVPKAPPSYEVVTIKPGFNSFDDDKWERLMENRSFTGLLETKGIHVNNKGAFDQYNEEIQHILEGNEEYKEAKKAKKLAEAEKTIVDLSSKNTKQAAQINELLKRVEQLEVKASGNKSS